MEQYLNEDHIPVMQDVVYFRELRYMFRKYINMYMEETCAGVEYLINEWSINESYLQIYWYNEDTDEEDLCTQVKTDVFLEWCKNQ